MKGRVARHAVAWLVAGVGGAVVFVAADARRRVARRVLGWPLGITTQLSALALVAMASSWFERRGSVQRARAASVAGGRAWILHGPWPLPMGGVARAVLNALTLLTAGHRWTITWAFPLWGGKILQATGYDLSTVPFWDRRLPACRARRADLRRREVGPTTARWTEPD